MWWLLSYLAYAGLATVAIGAAGYAAITQLALLQRLLVVALERWLRQISANEDGSFNEYRVWHTETGVVSPAGAVGPGWALACSTCPQLLHSSALGACKFPDRTRSLGGDPCPSLFFF